jgi:hypothetical protein
MLGCCGFGGAGGCVAAGADSCAATIPHIRPAQTTVSRIGPVMAADSSSASGEPDEPGKRALDDPPPSAVAGTRYDEHQMRMLDSER